MSKASSSEAPSSRASSNAFELASQEGRRPAWEIALLFPDQGKWSVQDFLGLDAGRHVEFADGSVEFQPMPDEKHQAIVFFLVRALKTLAAGVGGKATMAPFPVRLWADKFREPDVVFMKSANLERCTRRFWDGADLVIEVLSDSNRDLDLHRKPGEYARAGIPEYWIVDPQERSITILVLSGESYTTHGVLRDGQSATSTVLDGFEVLLTDVLDAE